MGKLATTIVVSCPVVYHNCFLWYSTYTHYPAFSHCILQPSACLFILHKVAVYKQLSSTYPPQYLPWRFKPLPLYLSHLMYVTINIVQYLPLKDALCFSNISTTAFDTVYNTFAHRTILNFASCLDECGCIQLTDKDILPVMHAYTRAIEIHNFVLPLGPLRPVILHFHQRSPTFKSFDDLKFYFKAYLRGKGNGKLDCIHTPRVDNQPTHT